MSSNEGDTSTSTEGGSPEPGLDFDAAAKAAVEGFEIEQPGYVAIDTETSGVAYFDQAFCVTVAWKDPGTGYSGHYLELASEQGLFAARYILAETPTWVFHNAKFDLQKLLLAEVIRRKDIDAHYLHDTEAMAHLLDENRKKGLKQLAVDLLDYTDTITVEKKTKKGEFREVSKEKYELDEARRKLKLKIEDGYEVLPRAVVVPYAIRDAVFTAQLHDLLAGQLAAQDEELNALYRREMELTKVLLDVEAAGVKVDVPYLGETSRDLVRQSFELEGQILELSGREEFVNHHEWIKSALDARGVHVEDTQAETLAACGDPLAAAIVEWRRVAKLHSTYIQPMLGEERDGILHPNFRQHGTRTGRMSSGAAG